MRYRVTRAFDKWGRTTSLTLSFTHGKRATFVHARPHLSPDGFRAGWEVVVPGTPLMWFGNLRAIVKIAPTLARIRFNELAGE